MTFFFNESNFFDLFVFSVRVWDQKVNIFVSNTSSTRTHLNHLNKFPPHPSVSPFNFCWITCVRHAKFIAIRKASKEGIYCVHVCLYVYCLSLSTVWICPLYFTKRVIIEMRFSSFFKSLVLSWQKSLVSLHTQKKVPKTSRIFLSCLIFFCWWSKRVVSALDLARCSNNFFLNPAPPCLNLFFSHKRQTNYSCAVCVSSVWRTKMTKSG